MDNFLFLTVLVFVFTVSLYSRFIIRKRLIVHHLNQGQKLTDSDPEQAIRHFSAVLKVSRIHPEANWGLANIYLQKRQLVLAQMYLLEILNNHSYPLHIRESEVRETLAGIYHTLGLDEKALAQYYFLKSGKKLSGTGLKEVIRIHIEARHYKLAGQMIQDAFHSLPPDADLYYFRALCEYGEGNLKKAEETLELSIRRNKKNENIIFLLARIRFMLKKFATALECLEELPGGYLEPAERKDLLGQCFYNLKNFGGAIRELQLAVKERKNDQQPYYEPLFVLGCAYEANGQIREAINAWEELRDVRPADIRGKRKLEFFKKVEADSGVMEFIVSPFPDFVLASEKLIHAMNFRIKRQLYTDDRNLEYLCMNAERRNIFQLYRIRFTRQTTPVIIGEVQTFLARMQRERARFGVMIAPVFTDQAKLFGEKNLLDMYDFSVYRKYHILDEVQGGNNE